VRLGQLSHQVMDPSPQSIGWVVGGHGVEEIENRILAAHANAVVASVDYRTEPEYKFPYAVNDCFDASKWACSLSRGPSKVALGQS
jgi:acetyl esterase/lipase